MTTLYFITSGGKDVCVPGECSENVQLESGNRSIYLGDVSGNLDPGWRWHQECFRKNRILMKNHPECEKSKVNGWLTSRVNESEGKIITYRNTWFSK